MTLTRKRQTDLAHYKPEQGLKTIAVAEVLEKRYARAKDAAKLYAALEAKLHAQADFIAWWDAQQKQQGARGKAGPGRGHHQKRRSGSDTPFQAGKNGIPDRMVLHRWREKLADEAQFQISLTKIAARCQQMAEMQQESSSPQAHVSHNSGENEWYTPQPLIEAARQTMGGIDCDPASSVFANTLVKATRFFTMKTDGLTQPTWGHRVWMNPPYSASLVQDFTESLLKRLAEDDVREACVLVNNATETGWFQGMFELAAAVCFLRGRVKFLGEDGEPANTPLQGQAVLYFGNHGKAFSKAYRPHGYVVAPYAP